MVVAAALVPLLVPLAAVAALPLDSACARARYFLLNRHLGPGFLDSCEAALAADTGRENEERLALRAQLLMVRGDGQESREAKAGLYAAARAAADSLRAANERNPLGHLWWAAAHGRILELRGMAVAAAGAGQVRRENERALELDPNCALACLALGRMCEELPRLFGGSLKKAEAWLRRGVASDPDYTVIRLSLARVLAKQGRREEALAEIELLLAVTKPTDPAETMLDDRPAAMALLKQLSGSQTTGE